MPQAKLYESRRDLASAEQLYRWNLSRLEASGHPLSADAVEALLFIAARCKARLSPSGPSDMPSGPSGMPSGPSLSALRDRAITPPAPVLHHPRHTHAPSPTHIPHTPP